MQITTTHEIKPNHIDPKNGALIVHVFLNGTEIGTVQPLSGGPIADIEEFVAGKINMDEIRSRWGFKSQLTEEACDGEVEVEVIRTFLDLGVGTRGNLSYNGAARCYVLDLADRRNLEVPSHVVKYIALYLKRC